ncbi:DUF421 domain-containing protein [Jeotgalibacillus sp. ET6]|uniref:DUF421 domain-containing protein n=1 Tax=Jeotgalibacillus sp. ET6 TaxID=3037260 RepID=UPI0024187D5B|nr:DUF421 domain-containing protein [Jeotgalibacillus sp. ET6]MDG5472278.1 DUF421 domain-containing protein [Jeotgalibacillus sp. ET6]
MDFFSGQESLSILEWGLRAVIGFFFLVLIAKIMGQRSISQLRFMDFVMALLIGNIIAHPLSDEGLGMTGSITTMSVLVTLYLSGVFLTLHFPPLKRLVDPAPITLIENGQIYYRHLKKARITVESLLAELRKEQLEDFSKVALALWEPGGTISVFPDPKYQPLTPADMGMASSPFELPRMVVKEGKINRAELMLCGKDDKWLLEQIHSKNEDLDNILIATVTKKGEITVCVYR